MINRAGFIAVLGRPNVGKSTLLSSILKEKISIISNKPQTTREKIKIIHLYKDCQMIFLDTPGIQKPRNKLGNYMEQATLSSLSEADLILWLVDESDYLGTWDKYISELLKKTNIPVMLVINKVDLVENLAKVKSIYADFDFINEICTVSAKNNTNIEFLLDRIYSYMIEGPAFYPEDMITDRSERFIVGELIREKALHYLDEEIPHGIAVEIEKMKNREDKPICDIDAVIYCEKQSHKGIIIGKNGRKLKGIGKSARIEIQKFLDIQVNLTLWVKVNKNWREKAELVKRMGYKE